MICCYQVTKLFCSRYSFASASSARSPCHLGSLADFAILGLLGRDFHATLVGRSESESGEVFITMNAIRILKISRITQEGSRVDIGHSSDQEKKNGMERTPHKPEGKWNPTADVMFENFKESGHPTFRGINVVDRGVRLTSGRNLRMQSFYFAKFTQ